MGASGSQAVWSMDLFKMNRAGLCTFHRPEYFICSRGCVKASGSPLLFFIFYWKEGTKEKSEKETEVWYVFRKLQCADYWWKCVHISSGV